ncbi:MAG: hypothetical protein NTV98_02000 [Candidatus Roizmanbacteria bacterium]|nr:hypothetical protein [Candidatus Roizmanbacteria bacterium]
MRRNLHTVLEYFAYFLYAPSSEEIYTFFPKKISKKNLTILLEKELKGQKILRLPNNMHYRAFQGLSDHYSLVTNHVRYTLPQYSTQIISDDKKKLDTTVQIYISLLKMCPLVRFVGVTGKSAMRGLQNNDDLDLCIVTKHTQLWTTRFFVVMCAKILGIHTKTGVCLNLFFDEQNVVIPHKKQNSYIAHEMLQMKKIVDKDHIYERFLFENSWLLNYFPNVKSLNIKRNNQGKTWIMCTWIDYLFRAIQLPIIIRNRTAFLITTTQLWLFKNDFEKKLKRVGLVI